VHRTAVVTVGDAAVHAPRGLVAQGLLAVRDDELAVVLDAFLRIGIAAILAVDLEEAGFLAHVAQFQKDSAVIPAKAGSECLERGAGPHEAPAFAGMTG